MLISLPMFPELKVIQIGSRVAVCLKDSLQKLLFINLDFEPNDIVCSYGLFLSSKGKNKPLKWSENDYLGKPEEVENWQKSNMQTESAIKEIMGDPTKNFFMLFLLLFALCYFPEQEETETYSLLLKIGEIVVLLWRNLKS